VKKSIAKTTGISSGVLSGAMYGGGVTLLLSLLLALLTDYEKITWDSIGYGIMFTLFLSAFCCATISIKIIKRQKLLVCLLSAIFYLLLLITVTLVFFGGQYYAIVPSMLPVAAGTGAAGLLISGKAERKKYRYMKM